MKIYHTEEGSERMREIFRSDGKIFVSELGRIEFLSTIHRKYRENEIDEATLDALTERFRHDIENRYEILGFCSPVLDEAKRLIKNFA